MPGQAFFSKCLATGLATGMVVTLLASPALAALPFKPLHPLHALQVKREDLKPFKIVWLGHAAFQIYSPEGTEILIDPYLTQDPATPARYKDLNQYHPKAILITHSHFDHVGDAVAIAQTSKAQVLGAFEEVSSLKDLPKEQQQGMNVGGTLQIEDVTVHVVPAMHSSDPGGRPIGFVLTFRDDRSIYHTGDTWIFGDMALIQELYHPNIILLNTGGGPYTEDPKTAALAIKKYFDPEAVIPMHYGTYPALATQSDVEAAFQGDSRVKVIKPGDSVMF